MGTLTVPHWLATQVAVMHGLAVSGQSAGEAQLPAIPPVPIPPVLVVEPPPVPEAELVVEPPPVPIPPAPPLPELVLVALEVALDEAAVLVDSSPEVAPVEVVPPVSSPPPQPMAEGRRARAEASAMGRGVKRMMARSTVS